MSWQRSFFFRVESLQITAGERRVIMLFLTAGLITTGLAHFLPARTLYDKPYYKPVIEEFKKLSRIQEQENMELLARYYPNTDNPSGHEDTEEQQPELAESIHEDTEVQQPELTDAIHEETEVQQPELADTIHFNTATMEELTSLPGIGPVTARRLLEFREENDSIKNINELLNVSGIGPVTIDNIRDQIVFD